MSEVTAGAELRAGQYATGRRLATRTSVHERYSTNPTPWFGWVFDHLLAQLPPVARVLEVGCGTGELWRHNAARIPPGWQVTLSDFSPGMLADARRALGRLAERFGWLVADAAAIPCQDGVFDAVVANHVLYHLPDPAAGIRELARVLRGCGRLWAAANGRRHLAQLRALVARHLPQAQAVVRYEEAERFGAETGGPLLAAAFEQVEVLAFPNALRVTETEPLVAFIASMPGMPPLTEAVAGRVAAEIGRVIAREGAFWVEKATVLFCCRRGVSGAPS